MPVAAAINVALHEFFPEELGALPGDEPAPAGEVAPPAEAVVAAPPAETEEASAVNPS